jgi:hypothetical protein
MLTEATMHQNTLLVPFMLPLTTPTKLEVPQYRGGFISILLIAARSTQTSRLNSKLVSCGFQVDWLDLAVANFLTSMTWSSGAELIVLDLTHFTIDDTNLWQKLSSYLRFFKLPVVMTGSSEQIQRITDQLQPSYPVYQLNLDGQVEAKIVQFITEINYLTRRYS